MSQIILPNGCRRSERIRIAFAWRKYNALQSLLTEQMRRSSEIDAMLGVFFAVEGALFVWFLERTCTFGDVHRVVVTLLMVMPLILVAGGAFVVRPESNPNVEIFEKALSHGEIAALHEAILVMLKAFRVNRAVVVTKEVLLGVSATAFFVFGLAYMLMDALQWG